MREEKDKANKDESPVLTVVEKFIKYFEVIDKIEEEKGKK